MRLVLDVVVPDFWKPRFCAIQSLRFVVTDPSMCSGIQYIQLKEATISSSSLYDLQLTIS